MRVTAEELEGANRRLEGRDPLAVLREIHATFGRRAALLSSMQRAGTVLCHMADRAGLDLDVVFVDTGVLHAETLATRDVLARTHPRLRVVTLQPPRSFAEQTAAEGLLYVTKEGQERCCDLRKSEPLLGERGRWDVLISALRRGEGGAREAVRPLGIDAPMNALRAHPLAAFTDEALDAYVAAHPDVVVNPLHAMGFPSIGCYTCTTPVLPGEPARAGRWRHLAGVTYCGINPVDRAAAPASVELDDRYAPFLATA